MASPQHEAPLFLMKERPELLATLLGLAGFDVPPFTHAASASADFTQAVPIERRADAAVTLHRDDEPVMALVLEVQLAIKEEKRFAWPFYVASQHAKLRCPSLLVVFTPHEGVARWASEPIRTMQPNSPFTPFVLGPSAIPKVESEAEARASPELAILSALVHGHRPEGRDVIVAAVDAAAHLDDERAGTYYDLLFSTLGELAREALEAVMAQGKWEYQSDFAKKYVAQGRAEGRADGARSSLLAVVEARSIRLSSDAQARIEACEDPATLERWTARAAVASTENEVFGE